MAVVEKFLHEHFANLDDDAPEPASLLSTGAARPATESQTLQEPFAKVNTVAEGSPAQSAGLKPGDEIRVFGYVNRSNHDNLKRVGECVQGNEDVSHHSQPILMLGLPSHGTYTRLTNLTPDAKRPISSSEYHGHPTTWLSVRSFV